MIGHTEKNLVWHTKIFIKGMAGKINFAIFRRF